MGLDRRRSCRPRPADSAVRLCPDRSAVGPAVYRGGDGPCRPSPGRSPTSWPRLTALPRRIPGLPRVRYWQIWNEPNLSQFLMPQADDARRPVSPEIYRALVNAAYGAIHAVHPDNMVIAGGTIAVRQGSQPRQRGCAAPVHAQASMPVGGTAPATRLAQARFDSTSGRTIRTPRAILRLTRVFRTTSRSPTSGRCAYSSKPLGGSERCGNRGATRFWVTEITWDTNPPDPQRRAGDASCALGGGGDVPNVGSRSQPRDLVPAP